MFGPYIVRIVVRLSCLIYKVSIISYRSGTAGPLRIFSFLLQQLFFPSCKGTGVRTLAERNLLKSQVRVFDPTNEINIKPQPYSSPTDFAIAVLPARCIRIPSKPTLAIASLPLLNMDAQAYLMRHGWGGPGNPLNPNQRPGSHGGLGLTKPILVARKQNNHGVGKKTTKDHTNQWWLRGFEDALKGVGDDSYEATSAKTSNALTSELYRFFVRGQGLAGTIHDKKTSDVKGAELDKKEKSKSKSKRKRDTDDEDSDSRARKEEKAARKEKKSKRRKVDGDVTESSETSGSEKRKESKEERRARRKEKKEKKEHRKAEKASTGGDDTKDKKKSKKSKQSASEEGYPTPVSTADTTETEEVPSRSEVKEKREDKKSKKENRESDSKKKSKKDKKEKKSSTIA